MGVSPPAPIPQTSVPSVFSVVKTHPGKSGRLRQWSMDSRFRGNDGRRRLGTDAVGVLLQQLHPDVAGGYQERDLDAGADFVGVGGEYGAFRPQVGGGRGQVFHPQAEMVQPLVRVVGAGRGIGRAAGDEYIQPVQVQVVLLRLLGCLVYHTRLWGIYAGQAASGKGESPAKPAGQRASRSRLVTW